MNDFKSPRLGCGEQIRFFKQYENIYIFKFKERIEFYYC